MHFSEVNSKQLDTFTPFWSWSEAPRTAFAFLSDDNNEPISFLRLFDRTLKLQKSDRHCMIEVLGIGGLFTVNELRGRGIASELIKKVISVYPEYPGFVAISRKNDSVFLDCGFKAIRTSENKKNQDVYFYSRYMSLNISSWQLIPGNHF